VVTSFEFQLHEVGTVLAGLLIHPLERARELLRFYREYAASAPDELTAYAVATTTPDGLKASVLAACYCGDDLDQGARLLEPLRKFGPPIADTIAPMSYVALQQMWDAGFPYGIRSYWKSTFLSSLSDGAIDVFASYAQSRTSPRAVCGIEPWHGKAQRVAPQATAFGLRKDMFSLHILTQWEEGDPEPHIRWTRSFWKALQPYSAGTVYVNVLSNDDAGRIREAYGANYPRLIEIKRRYDPANLFRVNQNIAPATGIASV
jgi:FAD/FMN-containing dehydrogenase